MSNRRIVNVPKARQRDLAAQLPWLMEVDNNARPENVQILSVSVFDHWLSHEEACEKLENVPAAEQRRRDMLLADFCSRMFASTEVMSFAQRGRQCRRIIFRRFLSEEVISGIADQTEVGSSGTVTFRWFFQNSGVRCMKAGTTRIIFSLHDQGSHKLRGFGRIKAASTCLIDKGIRCFS